MSRILGLKQQPPLSASPLPGRILSALPRIAAPPTFPNQLPGKMSGVSATGSAVVETGRPPKIASFNELIESLIKGEDLLEADAEASLDFLLDDASEALISAFLVLLGAKGETYEEIVGMARAMIKYAKKVEGLVDVVDIVGTGRDGANTVNISTGRRYSLLLVVPKLQSKGTVPALQHVEVQTCWKLLDWK